MFWFIENCLMWIILYFSLFKNNIYCFRVLQFILIFYFATYVIGLFTMKMMDNDFYKKQYKQFNTINKNITFINEFLFCCVLVSFGHYILGTIVILSYYFVQIYKDYIKERIEKIEKEN